MNQRSYCLDVRGPWACFTRPEMKGERVSYDLITPSAARAIFEAIFWKPGVDWVVRRIELLAPVRWANLRRNEVGSVVPVRTVQQAMDAGQGQLALYVDEDRQQRASLLLRDVAYRLHADLVVREPRPDPSPATKFFAMFERRARQGQCVNQPYLGCREFDARWRLVEDASSEAPALAIDQDFGWMLDDLDFTDPDDPHPRFFRAVMRSGVVEVPRHAGGAGGHP